ncbi:MAG: BTAD domain-containing putative transcriptional regulator [Actinomycetota bacterium]
MELRLLGGIEAIATAPVALGGPTQRRLLGLLALHHGEVVSVDRMVDATWPGTTPPERAERNVHSYVHRLRSALNGYGDRVVTVGRGYRLVLSEGELDIEQFDQRAATARACAAAGEHAETIAAANDALEVWRGRPFGEFADEPWAQAEVNRLDELHAELRELRAAAYIERGKPELAVADLEALAADHPYRERPQGLLMRALYHSGRHAEALRAFQQFRRRLIDEVGVEPSQELVDLDRSIATDALDDPATKGTRTIGAYEVGERIGEGAFAVVYRGVQPGLDREVAIKVVRAELANRPEFVRRFAAEAQMVATLEHPHIVPLYDFWREPDRAYLVMRMMAGGNLQSRLDDGPLGPNNAVVIVDEIAAALTAAHEAGIVHRDVKPENIMFDGDGRAYLGDFGIALDAESRTDPAAALSEGSPLFAAPEQLRHEPVGPEADVYALATVAFTMLVGRAPFESAPDANTLLHHQLESPLPAVGGAVPATVDDVLRTATVKSAADRLSSAQRFAVEFARAVAGDNGAAAAPVTRGRRRRDPASNPYKGLHAFDETDAGDFFGRERLTDELIAALRESDNQLLAVVGPSGSGKSSVVRAGLIPELRRGRVPGSDRWFVTTMTPGGRPFESLETALLRVAVNPPGSLLEQLADGERGILRGCRRILPDDHTTVLLVIDQFEELFTGDIDPAERNRFIDALVEACTEPGTPIRVVLTLRADFFDQPLRHPRLAPMLKRRTIAVTPLAPDELERAIAEPAEAVGVGYAPGVVAQITADVADRPGALPLVQYALARMFDAGDGGVITLDDYGAVGGVSLSIARRAEELWEEADPQERPAIRRVFERLVHLGENAQDTRRRVVRNELPDDAATAAALDRYGSARLLTFDRDPATREPTVEVAHEALIQQWPRFREWLDDDRAALRAHRHLTAAATSWRERDEDAAELYRGARLDAVVEMIDAGRLVPNDVERGFVEASRAAREADQERERRRVARLRGLLATTAVIAVLALIAGVIAVANARRADSSAQEASQRRLMAESEAAAVDDPSRALLLGLEAHRAQPSAETLGLIQNAFVRADHGWLGEISNGTQYRWVRFLPDSTLVALHAEGVERWDVDDRTMLASVELPGGPVDLDVAADGGQVVIGLANGDWVILDAATLTEVDRGVTDTDIALVRWNPDRTNLAVGGFDGSMRLHGLDGTVTELGPVVDLDGNPVNFPPDDIAFRGDGGALAVAFGGGVDVYHWDLTQPEGGQPIPKTEGARFLTYDGDELFAAMGEVHRIDSTTLQPIDEPIDLGRSLDTGTRLHVDGDRLTWAGAGQYDFVDLTSGAPLGAKTVTSPSVSFGGDISPDGTILAQGIDTGIHFHALDGAGIVVDTVVPAPPEPTQIQMISTDGSTVAQGGNVLDGVETRLFDLTDGVPEPVEVTNVGWGVRVTGPEVVRYQGQPDATTIDVETWNAAADAWEPLTVVDRQTFGFNIPVFSPDGSELLHGWNNGDDILDIYDRSSGELLTRLTDVQDNAGPGGSYALIPTYTPDGERVVFPNAEQIVAIYDADSWELVDLLPADQGFQSIVFLPDGERAITQSIDGLEVRPVNALDEVLLGPIPLVHDLDIGRVLEITDDGRYLKTGGLSGAQLWDPETLIPIGSQFPDDEDTWAATLATETNQLATTVDGATVIWDIDLDSWLERACLAAGRNLTQAEWDLSGPDEPYRATCDRWPAGN